MGSSAPVQDPKWKADLDEAQEYERAFLQTRDRIQSIIDSRFSNPSSLRELPRLLQDLETFARRAGMVFAKVAKDGCGIGLNEKCSQKTAGDSLTPQEIMNVTYARLFNAKELGLLVEVHKGVSTALAPGGGLATHEGGTHGGHTIAKHIAQSEKGLRARLAVGRRSPAAVSTFPNQDVAERSIARVLLHRGSEIDRWKQDRTSELALDAFLDANIGVIIRKSDPVTVATHGLRVILCKDTEQSLGYSIKTAYPILCPPKQ